MTKCNKKKKLFPGGFKPRSWSVNVHVCNLHNNQDLHERQPQRLVEIYIFIELAFCQSSINCQAQFRGSSESSQLRKWAEPEPNCLCINKNVFSWIFNYTNKENVDKSSLLNDLRSEDSFLCFMRNVNHQFKMTELEDKNDEFLNLDSSHPIAPRSTAYSRKKQVLFKINIHGSERSSRNAICVRPSDSN